MSVFCVKAVDKIAKKCVFGFQLDEKEKKLEGGGGTG
jgi:hypothetical protein